jgi:hypothetical protein
MKLIHFLSKTKILLIVFSLFFVACQDNTPEKANTDDQNDDLSSVDLGGIAEKQNDVKQTYEKVLFDKLIVSSNYAHFYQKDATRCGGNICLADAIMMASKIHDTKRIVDAKELDRIAVAIKIVPKCVAGFIGDGANFLRKELGSKQRSNEAYASTNSNPALDKGRDLLKTAIQAQLSINKPTVALVRITASGLITTNTTSTFRHFVVIVGLKYVEGGTGSIISYIDPLDRTAKIRTADYTTFLSSIKAASTIASYNIIRVGF